PTRRSSDLFVREYVPIWRNGARQRERERTAARAGLDNARAVHSIDFQQDVADFLRINDGRRALDVHDLLKQRHLQQQVRMSAVRAHRSAKRLTDDLIVLDETVMRVKRCAGDEPHEKALVIAAN